MSDLITSIKTLRDAGIVTIEFRNRATDHEPDAIAAIDQFFSAELGHNLGLPFHAIGDSWIQIDRTEATLIVARILHRDLAYGGEMMEAPIATVLSEQFMAKSFSNTSQFFTNATWAIAGPERGRERIREFQPATNSTFDTGIVGIDDKQIGMIWVQDED